MHEARYRMRSSGSRLGGAQGWNRTTDTRIFSPLLYRLSYLGQIERAAYLIFLRLVSQVRGAYSSVGI